jgi:hypothetical protein
MIQLAWRFLMFQKDSALAHWFYARTKNAPQTRKTMIVALARKLLIALWRLVREGAIPQEHLLRLLSPAADLTWSTPWAEMGQGTIPAIAPPFRRRGKSV